MVEISSVESIERNSIDTLNLNNQQFILDKINEIENYFIAEISGSISIASFATVIGIPIGIASASLSLNINIIKLFC